VNRNYYEVGHNDSTQAAHCAAVTWCSSAKLRAKT